MAGEIKLLELLARYHATIRKFKAGEKQGDIDDIRLSFSLASDISKQVHIDLQDCDFGEVIAWIERAVQDGVIRDGEGTTRTD